MKIKKFLLFFLGNYFYIKFRKLFYLIVLGPPRLLKKLLYNVQKDLDFNKKIFDELNLNYLETKQLLKKNNIDADDENLSWHYFLFAGLKIKYEKENKSLDKILEIGTNKGEFTNFISLLFPNAKIHTIDLAKNTVPYKPNASEQQKISFFENRDKNLNKNNIIFKNLHSSHIGKEFSENSFDIIWIDGDHLYPQVAIDIFQSIKLAKKNSIICVDDIIIGDFKTAGHNNDSYKCLTFFENMNLIKNYYINKRARKRNFNEKKYISYGIVNK